MESQEQRSHNDPLESCCCMERANKDSSRRTYHMKRQWMMIPILVAFFFRDCEGQLQIPGTRGTESGYDTRNGSDPICWLSTSLENDHSVDENANVPRSGLVQDFRATDLTLLRRCPQGMNLTVDLPEKEETDDFWITGETYIFHVGGTINTTTVEGDYLVSDSGAFLSIEVILCELGSGFCSPFVKTTNSDDYAHSSSVFVRVPVDVPNHVFETTVEVTLKDPGEHFVIGALHFFTSGGEDSRATYRYDVANVVNPRHVLTFRNPPKILGVRRGIEIAVWTGVGIASCVILALLAETYRNRNHQIMTLCQGNFLLLFLSGALVATACAGMMNPEKDVYCEWSTPIMLIAAQLVYAVTIGRLWRINRVISPLLANHFQHGYATFLSNLISRLASCGKVRPVKLRVTVSQNELAVVITFFTLPQVILQIMALVLQRRTEEIRLNEAGTIGRHYCRANVPFYFDLVYYGMLQVVLLNVFLLAIAYGSQNLPSLFVEAEVIYATTVANALVFGIGIIVIVLTRSAESSPEVEYVAWALLIIGSTVNSAWRIMMPKLRMVWRNEKILVSRLVSDQKMVNEKKQYQQESMFQSLKDGNLPEQHSERPASSDARVDSGFFSNASEFETFAFEYDGALTRDENGSFLAGSRVSGVAIEISDDAPPSRHLVLPMVRLKEKLIEVTNRITAGIAVSHDDWEAVRTYNADIAYQFKQNITFQWEEERPSATIT